MQNDADHKAPMAFWIHILKRVHWRHSKAHNLKFQWWQRLFLTISIKKLWFFKISVIKKNSDVYCWGILIYKILSNDFSSKSTKQFSLQISICLTIFLDRVPNNILFRKIGIIVKSLPPAVLFLWAHVGRNSTHHQIKNLNHSKGLK